MARSLAERFWPKVEKTDGCWLWTASVNGPGYGKIMDDQSRRLLMAHRVAYELVVGSIPDGLYLDHLCRNPRCVNPEHLEPVTEAENNLRGVSIPAENARKTHCKRGHPLSGDNLYVGKNRNGRPMRACRTCRRATDARRSGAAAALKAALGG